MTPVQILYLNPTAQLGGAEYSLLDLAASLDRRRFAPLIACMGDGPLVRAAEARGVEAISLELPSRFGRLSLKGRRSGPLALAASAMSAAPLAWRIRRLASRAGILHTNGNKAHVLGGLA